MYARTYRNMFGNIICLNVFCSVMPVNINNSPNISISAKFWVYKISPYFIQMVLFFTELKNNVTFYNFKMRSSEEDLSHTELHAMIAKLQLLHCTELTICAGNNDLNSRFLSYLILKFWQGNVINKDFAFGFVKS